MTFPGSALPPQWTVLGEEQTPVILEARITAQLNALRSYYQSAVSTYTPAITSTGTTPTLGSSPIQLGEFKFIGDKLCWFMAYWVWGTSPTVGGGFYLMSLPTAWVNDGMPPSFAADYATSGGAHTQLMSFMQGTTTIGFAVGGGTSNALDPTHPAAPAAGASLHVTGVYRVA